MPDTRDTGAAWYTARVDTSTGQVPVRVIEPHGHSAGWLVWAHGGSWPSGSAQDWHHACAGLADIAGVTVASVDYRVAPRHPHPAALHDVTAALAWARRQATADGVPVAVGGHSAGGTIAACAALVLRERGVDLAAQVLAHPPIDPLCRAGSCHRDPTAFPQADRLATAWRSYRGAGHDNAPTSYRTPAGVRRPHRRRDGDHRGRRPRPRRRRRARLPRPAARCRRDGALRGASLGSTRRVPGTRHHAAGFALTTAVAGCHPTHHGRVGSGPTDGLDLPGAGHPGSSSRRRVPGTSHSRGRKIPHKGGPPRASLPEACFSTKLTEGTDT
ncbi:alpha/beta hydrolase fold domain-containing protein [Micromonospora sp. NPDC005305]|uniref:alpha/beta hydrolase n=1 Tax=Micromonospora sp. NPDC005305 TaxID=3156875 RepID=UPI0033A36874